MILLLKISVHKQWTAVIVEVKTKRHPPDCYFSEHIGPHLSILRENGRRSECRIGRTTGHTCDL